MLKKGFSGKEVIEILNITPQQLNHLKNLSEKEKKLLLAHKRK